MIMRAYTVYTFFQPSSRSGQGWWERASEHRTMKCAIELNHYSYLLRSSSPRGKGNYLLKLPRFKCRRPYDTAQKIDHSLLIHIIKVFKQWPIDFEKVSPSLLSAAQLTLAGLYTSH